MMKCKIYKITQPADRLDAAICLPASKSISNRALILSALAGGGLAPQNLSDCDDTQVMIKALKQDAPLVDIMAAGTAMRFLTAYFSVTPGTRVITGTARMQQRPIGLLVDALRQLGADISYEVGEGFPPLRISGRQPDAAARTVSLPGSVSSQYISALLMIGAVLPQGLELHLTGEIVSRPYINLTLELMRQFGAEADWKGGDVITVAPRRYADTPFCCESDWSAASYWYEVMALCPPTSTLATGSVELFGLFARSHQGDSRGAALFAKLGVRTEYTDRGVRLTRAGIPAGRLNEDMTDIPDLAQTFVVTCCLLGIPFRFTGLQSLKIKETDRIAALIAELRKLGYVVRAEADSILLWDGERCPADEAPVIATYEDHRMAMAFAPACLALPQASVCIAEPQVVSKSYPAYWEHLRQAGFGIEKY